MACSKPALAGDVKHTAVAVLDQGVSKAMALRMKYLTTTDAGQIKRRLPLLTLSVHPENRGGVYPKAMM